MINEMRVLGLPDPEFTEHQDVVVTFHSGIAIAEIADLNERQRIGLQIVRERGSIGSAEYCAATGATERTALRDLKDLVERGLLVVRGQKRWQRYVLP